MKTQQNKIHIDIIIVLKIFVFNLIKLKTEFQIDKISNKQDG
jgi:hypothetical protein